ncbi:hypothetical protein E3U55_16050 [Filobacillus milosensis]|uniref:Yip1 domain-containing protein n=1 Tax=Filobacillus milosensis TaxID=94137 RepID=A0A4Y8IED0_9BACI|nr:YIP1 family protein [Filobacillus milosensis]TFB13484.1 hypothetical protein E3U55_16050 [Filobacillus milosensis]
MKNNKTNSPSLWRIFYKPTSQFIKIKEDPIILKPLIFIILIIVIEIILVLLTQRFEYSIFGETVTVMPWYLLVNWTGTFLLEVITNLLIFIFIISLFSFLVAKLFRLIITYKQIASMMTHIYTLSIINVTIYVFLPRISDGGSINDWFYQSILITYIIVTLWQVMLVVNGLKVISTNEPPKIFYWLIAIIFLLFNTYLFIHFNF